MAISLIRPGRKLALAICLLQIVLLIAGCAGARREVERAKTVLFRQLGFQWLFADYNMEGHIAVIHNDCIIESPPPMLAMNALQNDADQVAYENYMNERINEIVAECVDEVLLPTNPDDLRRAIHLARLYKRIEVPGSLNSFNGAIDTTFAKLVSTSGGVVAQGAQKKYALMIYLPQGPRAERVDWDDYEAYFRGSGTIDPIRNSMFNEANDLLCGCYPNEHPVFSSVLDTLVSKVTRGYAFHESDGPPSFQATPICVNSKSYSAHQTLDVIRDNERVFYYNIGPSFGLFELGGKNALETGLPNDCANGINYGTLEYPEICCAESEQEPFLGIGRVCEDDDANTDVTGRDELQTNPLISDYALNLQQSRVPQCMITSYQDGATLYGVGSALSSGTSFDFAPWNRAPLNKGAGMQCEDGMMVGYVDIDFVDYDAKRSCPPLLGLDFLTQYLPPCHPWKISPGREYPLCERWLGFAYCPDDFTGICHTGPPDFPYAPKYVTPDSSIESRCYSTSRIGRTDVVPGPCYRYGNENIYEAIYDNLDTGWHSIRIMEANASEPINRSVNCHGRDLDRIIGDEYCQAGHMEYFEGGGSGDVEPKIIPEIYNCTTNWIYGTCVACETCSSIMGPTDPVVELDQTITLMYPARGNVTGRHSGEHCDYEPCLEGDEDVRSVIKPYDVIYLPNSDYATREDATADYYDHIRPFLGDTQFHLSYRSNMAPIATKIVPNDDYVSNDRITQIELLELTPKGSVPNDVLITSHYRDIARPLPDSGPLYERALNRTEILDWTVSSLLDPRGKYYGLSGAWFTLKARAEYDVYDDNLPGISDHTGETRDVWSGYGSSFGIQVLVMKWGQETVEGHPAKPLPLPKHFDWHGSVVHYADSEPKSVSAHFFIPGSTFYSALIENHYALVEIRDATTDELLHSLNVSDSAQFEGFFEHYGTNWSQTMESWDVQDTWCSHYSDALICPDLDITLPAPPSRLNIKIRMKAYNGGNYFYRDWDSFILRSQCHDSWDNDQDGWTDSADPDCGLAESGFGSSTCNDGKDNDGDGKTDSEDRECIDALANESAS